MEEKIFKIVSKIIGIPQDEITRELSPDNVETWDSLLQMELLVALEEEFEIEFSDDQIATLTIVGEIVDAITDLIKIKMNE